MMKYALVPRKRIMDSPDGTSTAGTVRIYAAAVSEIVDLGTIAERITEATTVTATDVMAVLTALQSEVASQFKSGNAVDMERLGRFYPTLQSTGVDESEQFTVACIKKVRLRYRPSSDLQKELNRNANFELTITKKSARKQLRADREELDRKAAESREDDGQNNG